jgi:hypothetical protein
VWQQAFKAEMATVLNVSSGLVLADITKCFENVNLLLLFRKLLYHGFNQTIAGIVVKQYSRERILLFGKSGTRSVYTNQGIIAGCAFANVILSCYMLELMDSYTKRWPNISVGRLVDDITLQLHQNNSSCVIDYLADAAKNLCDLLSEHLQFQISKDKLQVVASDNKTAKTIVNILKPYRGPALQECQESWY